MTGAMDLDRAWIEKFRVHLEEAVGEEIRDAVCQGGDALSGDSNRMEVIEWTRQAMEKLESLVEDRQRRSILTACACHYSIDDIQEIRAVYAATKDIERAQEMLQEQFITFLKNTIGVSDQMVTEIVGLGWGSAGIKKGNTIIATKIPKSSHLVEYMNEADPEIRRQLYCHCPRVRDAVKAKRYISKTYCYCSAGFYQGIWEEIIQRPVEVEVLESVLSGGDVCVIAIYLPEDA